MDRRRRKRKGKRLPTSPSSNKKAIKGGISKGGTGGALPAVKIGKAG